MASYQALQVIDVRTPEEFAAGHIEGAKNIDFNGPDFATKLAALDKSKPVVVHCRAGGRSAKSLPAFQKAGFSKILHMKDGFSAWEAAKLPAVKE
jgi:phage shock protein E